MELVAILRVLWRRRTLVALGAVAAAALGVAAAIGEPSRVGVASVRVALDTPRSQLIDRMPVGAESLGWRAALLADLMVSEPVKRDIAREARVAPDSLAVVEPLLAAPMVSAPLPKSAAVAAAVTPELYLLAVSVHDELPIVSLDARAPSRRAAVRLAEAAARTLRAAASSSAAGPEMQGLVAESVGPVQTTRIVDGPRRAASLGIFIFVFVLWCGAVALFPRLPAPWRRR